MMSQSSQEYDPSKFVKSRSMTGPLPSNYMCFRCGKSGHWIKSCPTNNMEIKRSTGIPRSFMVPVDGPDHKGALLTSTGEYAVPLIDHQAYKEVKKEKPPFLNVPEPEPEPEPQLPEDLLCMGCKDLLQDAVLIPCCGNSFCDECARQALLDSENHECPICHETDISPNTLIPNRFLRTAVLNFKNETGYTRGKKTLLQPSVSSISSSTIVLQSHVLPSTTVSSSETPSTSVPDLIPLPMSAEVPVSSPSPVAFSSLNSPQTEISDSVQRSFSPPLPAETIITSHDTDDVSSLVPELIPTNVDDSSPALLPDTTAALLPDTTTSLLPETSPTFLPDTTSNLLPDPNSSLLPDQNTLPPEPSPALLPDPVLSLAPDTTLPSVSNQSLTLLPDPILTEYADAVSAQTPVIIEPTPNVGTALEVHQMQQTQLDGSQIEVPSLNYSEVDLSLSTLPPVVHEQEQVEVPSDIGIGVDDGQPGTPLADEPPVDLEPVVDPVDIVDQHTVPEDPNCVTSPFCPFPPDVVDADSREEAVMHPSEESPSGNIIMTITTIRERGHANMHSSLIRRRHPAIHPQIRVMRSLHGQDERACHQSVDTSNTSEKDSRREEGDVSRTRHQDQQEGRSSGNHRARDQISGQVSRTHRTRDHMTYGRRGGSRSQVRDPLPPRTSSHGRSGRHSSRPQYGTPPHEREYRSNSSNYRHSYSDYNQRHTSVHAQSNYEAPPQQPASHAITPRFSVQPSQHRIGAPPNYPGQVAPRPPGPSHVLPPGFPPQPPPPGSSPLSHVPPPPGQPPPPGVSPVLPPGPPPPPHHHGSFPPPLYGAKSYGTEDFHRELQRLKDRGIGEAMDDFTRELLEYRREQQHRSHGRRQRHGRSRSSSGSHSYSTSKSWSRSGSHSSRSWSRSRSHSFSYSSRSRSRSYSRSRSRSRNRSYSRSRSRSRSYHSRSRSRSRERHAASHHYNRSHSRSPKGYRSRGQRSPFQHKKDFSSSFFGTTFGTAYPSSAAAAAPAATSIPHGHSHAPSLNHPLEHYDDRFRYYHDQFRGFETYHSAYNNQRYDIHDLRHDNKHAQEYQKQVDETHQKMQNREKEKGRDNGRNRGNREYTHKKDNVKPQASSDTKGYSSKENQDDVKTKKKDEKIKHKKHHHHRNKESKKEKQENAENKNASDENKPSNTPVNLVKVEVLPDNAVENKKLSLQKETTFKEKKHKHKKRKEGEESGKKKSKNVHKDKSSTVTSSESDNAAKAKKKKNKSQIPVASESFTLTVHKEDAPVYVKKGLISEMYTEDTAEEDTTSEMKNTEKCSLEVVESQKEIEQRISGNNEIEPESLIRQVDAIKSEPDLLSDCKKESMSAEITCKEETVEDTVKYSIDQEIVDNKIAVEQDTIVEEMFNKDADENEDTVSDDVLHVELPAISKWEREEYEDIEEMRSPHRSTKSAQKEEKNSLPSDIIQRAEKAILQKALKAAIIEIPSSREKHKSDRKINTEKLQRSGEPSKESVYLKEKDVLNKDQLLERKEIIGNKERVESPTIQITITTDKERRSVQTKKKSCTKERNIDSDSSQSRKMKLDRSKFTEKSQGEEDFFNKFGNKDASQSEKGQSLILPKEALTRFPIPKRESEESEKIISSKKNKGRKQNSERMDKTTEETEKKSHQIEEKDLSKKHSSSRDLLGYIPDESHSSDDRRRPHVHSRKSDKNLKGKDYHNIKDLQMLRNEREDRRIRDYRSDYGDSSRDRRSGVSSDRHKMVERLKKVQRERSRSRSYDSRDSRSSDRRQHRQLKSYDENSDMRETRRKDSSKRDYGIEEKEKKKALLLNKITNRDKSKPSDIKDQDSTEKKKSSDKKTLVGSESSSTRHQKESTQDESKFEPNYDETSESEKSSDGDLDKKPKHLDSGKKRKASPNEGDSPKKHSKREGSIKVHGDRLTPLVKSIDQPRQKSESHKRGKSSSVSSSGSISQSDIETSGSEKSSRKKVRSESADSDHKHKHKKSRHKKHKKHKHKHKKKKSYKSRQKN